VDFHDTHLNDMWLFQNRIPGSWISFDLNSVLTRQTSEKVAYKVGLDYLLECPLPNTFSRKLSKISQAGRPRPVRLWLHIMVCSCLILIKGILLQLKPGFHMIVRIVPIVRVVSKNVQTIGTIIRKRYPDDRKQRGRLRRSRSLG